MIEVENLTKYYDERPAVLEVSFSVPRGQVLGFLGPNGAGKSTTMRILTGYISASEGSASIAGFDVFSESLEVRRRIGYLPETTPLYNEMRVRDYLLLMCRLRGVHPRHRQQRLDYAIEVCGLGTRYRDIIGRLSRGLRQRVGLAQAVVHDPDVLILDEPTSGLDPAQTRETRALISDLGRQHTVILSSHILPEVSATCERVVIINQGRLVADDTPDNLSRQLSAGRGIEVELSIRGDAVAAAAAIAKLPGVREVPAATTAPDGEGRLTVSIDSADVREALASAVVEGGFGLLEMRSRVLSLEEVYLQLTTTEEGTVAA
jgi:ABC-2 type transport system ATP-binding protein